MAILPDNWLNLPEILGYLTITLLPKKKEKAGRKPCFFNSLTIYAYYT
jgi:hypothetical protein